MSLIKAAQEVMLACDRDDPRWRHKLIHWIQLATSSIDTMDRAVEPLGSPAESERLHELSVCHGIASRNGLRSCSVPTEALAEALVPRSPVRISHLYRTDEAIRAVVAKHFGTTRIHVARDNEGQEWAWPEETK
jgi:hypothetical protein